MYINIPMQLLSYIIPQEVQFLYRNWPKEQWGAVTHSLVMFDDGRGSPRIRDVKAMTCATPQSV